VWVDHACGLALQGRSRAAHLPFAGAETLKNDFARSFGGQPSGRSRESLACQPEPASAASVGEGWRRGWDSEHRGELSKSINGNICR
jgi:hypothetical protein